MKRLPIVRRPISTPDLSVDDIKALLGSAHLDTASSPRSTDVPPPPQRSIRYRLVRATWTVVREAGQPSPRILDGPEEVAQLARDLIPDDDKEHFVAVYLNTKNHYLFHTEVSVGTQSATLVHPREVLGPALREGAASILLVHNHPSGDETPSAEDVRLTRQIAEAGRIMDIRLHDHLILANGSGRWISFAQKGII